MEQPKHVYGIYIRCTPPQLWEGITNGEVTRKYFHETSIESDWELGSPVVFRNPDGSLAVEGEVLEVDEPRRLSITWHALYNPAAANERPSRVTWEITQHADACRLSLVHDDFDGETPTYQGVAEGWLVLLCSLKSLIETGEPLPVVLD